MPSSSLTDPSVMPGAFTGVSAAFQAVSGHLLPWLWGGHGQVARTQACGLQMWLVPGERLSSPMRGLSSLDVLQGCSEGPREAACPRPPEPALVTTPVGSVLAGRVWPLATAHHGCPRDVPLPLLSCPLLPSPSPAHSAFRAHFVTLG